MTNVIQLTLTAAFVSSASARPKLDEVEQMLADQLKRLQPGPDASAEIHELAVTNELLALGSALSGVEFKTVSDRLRPRGPLDEALERVTEAHVTALGREGLGTRVIDILKSWMGLTIEVRVLERQLQVLRARGDLRTGAPAQKTDTASLGDPVTPLSAAELGASLGLGDESVRQRERAGKLFSVLRPGRRRGREYPAFQAWPGIAGEPLERALSALAPANGADAYAFFTSVTDLLGGLSPIEVLLGKPLSSRAMDIDATELLNASKEDRLIAVEKAAAATAAQLSA